MPTISLPPINWRIINEGVEPPAIASGVADFGRISRNKPSSVQRARPVGMVAMIDQATGRSTTQTIIQDAAFTTRIGKVKYESMSIAREYGGLGYGGEDSGALTRQNVIIANRLRQKARLDGTNLANMLGEYRQTASLFVDASKLLATATRAVLTRNPRLLLPRSGWTKPMARNFLAYQYGIKPLVDDLRSSIDDLKRGLDSRPLIIRLSASITENHQFRYSTPSGTIPGSVNSTTEGVAVSSSRGWGYVQIKRELLQSTLGAYGFTNPLSLAWELMPFSFVVDWWVNVGEVLSSLDNCLFFENGKYGISTLLAYTREVSAYGASAFYNQSTWGRSPSTDLGSVASLRYKPSISRTHLANGIALVRLALR